MPSVDDAEDTVVSGTVVVLPNSRVGFSRLLVERSGNGVNSTVTTVGGVGVTNGGGRGGFEGPSRYILGGGGIFVCSM